MRILHKIIIEYTQGIYGIHEALSDFDVGTPVLHWVGMTHLPNHTYRDLDVAQSVFEQMEERHYEIPMRSWDSIEHLTDVVYYEDEEDIDEIEDVLEMFR